MTKAEWLIRASMLYKGQVLPSLEGNYLWISLFMPFCNHCLHLYTAQHLVSTRETTRNACTVPNLTPNQKCHQRFEIHQRVLPWEITWCFYRSVLIWLFFFVTTKISKSQNTVFSHINHSSWTMTAQIWPQNKLSLISVEVRVVFLALTQDVSISSVLQTLIF